MKKYILLSFFAIVICIIYSNVGVSINDLNELTVKNINTNNKISNIQDNNLENIIYDSGEIQLTFCPNESCESMLLEFIESANTSLHCAFYEINLKSIQDAILEKNTSGIDVKIVTDNYYFEKFPYEFVDQDGYGYMHNKFCIADGKRVITGSMNPTENGAFKNNNNLITISSKELANHFEAEFSELWQGEFKTGEYSPINIEMNASIIESSNLDSKRQEQITIESYFCPDDNCAGAIVKEIQKANFSIYFMTFSFTSNKIANNILIKEQENLDIKGIFETRMNSKNNKFDVFDYQGIDVIKDDNPNSMHHKVFIIDNNTVITGSMNPSKNGANNNDETLLIIHSKIIANEFLEEFENLYNNYKN